MKKLSFLFFLIVSIICISHTRSHLWTGEKWKNTIHSDGCGYYAYLPSVFIYHNFDFKKQEPLSSTLFACYSIVDGKPLDKYFTGESILIAPFFLLAYLLSYLLGFPIDGYSLPFQVSVSIAALFYLIAGLIYTRRLLLEFKIPDWAIYVTLACVLFGTNLYYYATLEPSMSHTYSFCIIAVFLYYCKKHTDIYSTKYLICCVISLSLIILLRPINILVVALIPFIAGSLPGLKKFLVSIFSIKNILLLAIIFAALLSMQLFIWHAETGKYLVWSYTDESFHFNHPHFFSLLFSYRKGWFVYTPIMLIAVAGGLYTLYKLNKWRFYAFLFFFIMLTYIFSCWWNWYYGDSFGMRVFIDFYACFALLFTLFISQLKQKWMLTTTCIILLLLIGLNNVQAYQYENMILSHDNMTKSRYWKVFLKTNDKYKNIFYNQNIDDLIFYDSTNYVYNEASTTWLHTATFLGNAKNDTNVLASVSSNHIYGPTLVLNASQLPNTDNMLYVNLDMWVRTNDTNNRAIIVINTESQDKKYNGWKTIDIEAKTGPEWEHFTCSAQVPLIRHPNDVIKIFPAYQKGAFYFSNIRVRFGAPE